MDLISGDFYGGNGSVKNGLSKFVKNALDLNIPSGNGVGKQPYDRCERTVQMRLYGLSKGGFALVFLGFLAAIVLSIIIGLSGPSITTIKSARGSQLLEFNRTDISLGPFYLKSPVVSSYCQELWLMIEVVLLASASSPKGFRCEQLFRSSVEVNAVLDKAIVTPIFSAHNRSNYLQCVDYQCNKLVLAHLGSVRHSQYIFVLRFSDLSEFHKRFSIKDIVFYWKSYNPSFSHFEIWSRFTLVLVCVFVTIWFFQTMKAYSFYSWSMEQKWMSLLLSCLIFYNNPCFPLRFIVSGWFPIVLDTALQATFLCTLLLFWLCAYHGMRQTSSSKCVQFYLPKLLLTGLLWFCAVTLGVWDAVNQSSDPTWSPADLDSVNFEGFKIIFYITGAFLLLYLSYLLLRAYVELRNLSYFNLRVKFLTVLMFFAILVTVAVTVMRFGVVTTLQDNFISQPNTTYSTAVEFTAVYGIMNVYVYATAFIYSPNPNPAGIQKDQELLCTDLDMESDEEVVCTSDFNMHSRLSSDSSDGY